MAERYKRGDILLEFLNQKVLETPQMLQQWRASKRDDARIKAENRRLDLISEGQEKDREFKRQQARINQQNRIEAQAYKAEQDKKREMEFMLRNAQSPAQRAMVYNNFGQYDMAAQVKTEGDKVEDDNTMIENYWSESLGSSSQDVVSAGKNILSKIDLSHPSYSSIAERTNSAYPETKNPYRDMLTNPSYKLQYEKYEDMLKMPNADVQGIFEQMGLLEARYRKEFGLDKEDDTTGDDDSKLLSIDEQAERLVSGMLFKTEDSLDLGPQAEESVKQIATQVEVSSDINIGKLQSSLPKLENRKNILDRTGRLRNLTEVQAKELEQINATIKATKDEIKKQRSRLKQARKETKPFYTSPTATKLSAL